MRQRNFTGKAMLAVGALLVASAARPDEDKPGDRKASDTAVLESEIPEIKIDVKIDDKNPQAVVILVDLSGIGALRRITELSVPVQFYNDGGRLIATEKYQFTDTTVPVLLGGKKYKRSFEHKVQLSRIAHGKLKPLPARGMIGFGEFVYRDPSKDIVIHLTGLL